MINFIIYENNKKWQEYYKQTILKIIGNQKEKYHIYIFQEYTKEIKHKVKSLSGKNIYLLSLKVKGKTGIELAQKIREYGDWHSQIILISSHEEAKDEGLTSKILMLDFISKKENFKTKLTDALETALHIHSCYPSFSFSFNNEFYQIPYEDILFFEKDLNNNYTSIITKDKIYKIKKSIKKIEEEIDTLKVFFKTHQSCIVNIRNIIKVDFNINVIYFKKEQTNLLSRAKKKELKTKLENSEHLYETV